jgi:hypothetical protein
MVDVIFKLVRMGCNIIPTLRDKKKSYLSSTVKKKILLARHFSTKEITIT